MKIVKNLSEISEIVSDLYKSQKKINFIPTMGNIHPGHLSLITEANKFEGTNIVSIFINPAQFNDEDDFMNYPKTFEKDLEILSKTSCKIIFAPDKNLGKYLIKETGRPMILWEGACIVHEAFSFDKIIALAKAHPEAQFIAHPESESPVLEIAQYIGSTAGLLRYVQEDSSQTYIVATEAGILHEMQKNVPIRNLYPHL